MVTRRNLLKLGALGAGLVTLPQIGFAAGADTPKKFLFVIQRGAADGLATLAPIGDAAYRGLRGEEAERVGEGVAIGSDFALHPSLERVAAMHGKGDARFVHAVASPYRDRSHFDGQNVLETGGAQAYAVKDGWVNRLLGALPGTRAVALAPALPVALRGPVAAASFAPSRLPDATANLMARVGNLYAEDPELGPMWEQAEAVRGMAGDVANARDGAAMGELAANLMTGPDGASIVMVETDGWDTHYQQAGRLGRALTGLDALLGGFEAAMGDEWSDTLVIVATEFGRTAALNGTNGTDHGTASMAMLLGGAVKGGDVLADWPGLKRNALYQGRDLMPTLGLDALIASALAQHFGIDDAGALLFPQTRPDLMRETLIG
ncbi:DUF1501 domain-containing protein [Sphingomicrobium sediminis]|uniref:DUF1501 domain-containing protein n=1 Tax=Sphingomicrobium sediminis TaxID=2950949 RepID=A0A9X2EHA6_9SPHN|nr:DUF1501 domain-containing protein [Sphingomicrobium sediminis]MCM8557555.1 DUF1501 domain-containing protein [Sphingomicrobium sediminis]